MIQLHLKDLRFTQEKIELLGPVTAQIALSGVTAVLGPNGAGKTLFLQACHGSLTGAKGTALWDGVPAHRSRHQRGFVAQRPTVLRRSVRDNVAFALQAQNKPATNAQAVQAALQDAGLLALADRPAAALSGGELRRMAMARALVTDPKALLLDEPFNGLDPPNHRALEAMLTQVRARYVPILMISHNIALARAMADQILFVDAGHITSCAPKEHFFTRHHEGAIAQYLEGHLV